MNGHLRELVHLVPPPDNPTDAPSKAEREKICKEVRVLLPDYCFDFFGAYGSGAFWREPYDRMWLLNPGANNYRKELRGYNDLYRDMKDEEELEVPFDFHPRVPGLIYIGGAENQRAVFLLSDGAPNKWPVVVKTENDDWQQFPLSLAEFLLRLFKGELRKHLGDWMAPVAKRGLPRVRFEAELPLTLPQALFGTDEKVILKAIADCKDVNAVDRLGFLPLCATDKPKYIKLLLAKGADVNRVDAEKNTPLSLLCRMVPASVAAVQLLLKAGADVNATNPEGRTALSMAVENGSLNVTRLLLKNGADINQAANDGRTALAFAKPRSEISMLLKRHDAAKR